MKRYSLLLVLLTIHYTVSPRFSSTKHKQHKEIELVVTQNEKINTVQPQATAITPIKIKNGITKEMLTYAHWTGNHSPETFSIDIAGETIQEGEEKEITLKGTSITITYHYSFAKGLYKGEHSCSVEVPQAKEASVAFSWNKNPRLWLENRTSS